MITKHCRERYIQRIEAAAESENILFKILDNIKAGKDITDKIQRECPRYVQHLHEKYKEAGQRIFLNELTSTLFITKKRPGTYALYDVFTCYKYTEDYLATFKTSVLSNDEIYLNIRMLKKQNKKAS